MPYVEAANVVKQQTQQNGKNERQNKTVGGDSSKKVDNQKDPKKKDQVYSLNGPKFLYLFQRKDFEADLFVELH